MWHNLLKKNLKTIDALFLFLNIDTDNAREIKKQLLSLPNFAMDLPYRLAKKINKENLLNDPIFKQFIPTLHEKKIKRKFCKEPVKDRDFQKFNLIQKYKNRALLICSDRCAMNCRFCFRKNFKFKIEDSSFKNELAFLQTDKNISEAILSGGDPLMMENTTLENLLKNIGNIDHIKRIRFHTRMLIAFPQRIDENLLEIFKMIKKQLIFVLHVNHPLELDEEVFQSIFKLQSLNIPFLSQSVLLKGVNDNVNTLFHLFETLSNHGIIPYYLHQLDKVLGAAHFEVALSKGKKIIRELKELTSGYNVPSYVREDPYEKSKTSLV